MLIRVNYMSEDGTDAQFLYEFFVQISGEIPGASPDHMMSPVGNIGRRGHQFPYVNHSRMFVNQQSSLSHALLSTSAYAVI
jgi:hypothetical protein